ncbi:hypothetical protein CDAR_458671 [Caerostris darwini]|uniref:Uncharacterized protein n=1 Tax=Caerostris darwini TaxID=1538125 RepID=A0AAV4WV40_9ARAC|nr:hypothetical protein CDAR_458671 [Caerostris darwini]
MVFLLHGRKMITSYGDPGNHQDRREVGIGRASKGATVDRRLNRSVPQSVSMETASRGCLVTKALFCRYSKENRFAFLSDKRELLSPDTLVTPSPWKRIEGPTYLVACQPLRLLMPVRCPLPVDLGGCQDLRG